jgi:hypothetical protein
VANPQAHSTIGVPEGDREAMNSRQTSAAWLATAVFAATATGQSIGPWAVEEFKLISSDPEPEDFFGSCVAVFGDTALVGCSQDDNLGGPNAGAAYVFVRSGSTWSHQQKLTPSAAMPGDLFGSSVAISGDTAVIGATLDDHAISQGGAAYVFVRSGTIWSEEQRLTASDAASADSFGYSVAISGDTIVVGATRSDPGGISSAGAAYVYVRSGAAWSEQAKLIAGDGEAFDSFGASVAISGDTLLVGAYQDNDGGLDAGSAYVFERNGTTWSEQQKLVASDAAASDHFGLDLALSGDTAVIGAEGDDHSGGSHSGSAYVFEGGSETWSEQQKLTASDATDDDQFGFGVDIAGNAIVAGAAGGTDPGAAYVFMRSGTTWSEQIKLTASDGVGLDDFGYSVAISGDTAVAGAREDSHMNGSGAHEGSAYAYRISPGPPLGYCTAGASASGCQAAISSSGTPSATAASGFWLEAVDVEGVKDGMFFWGTNGGQANPWGNGTSFQCVVPPVTRGGLLAGGGTVGVCDGAFAQDLNALWCPACPKPKKNPGPGALVQAQLWYRDPQSTSNQPTSFSDALEFAVGL